jgi:signal transduction histidine kinase
MSLSGEWQFCFGKLLSAEEMMALPESQKEYLHVPSNWMKDGQGRTVRPAFGYGTYLLRIVLDSASNGKRMTYGFRVGDITTAYALYVNGELVCKTGKVGTDATSSVPMYYPHPGTVTVSTDTLNVVIHASNFFYPRFSGPSRTIFFGKRAPLFHQNLIRVGGSFILTCVLLLLCLFQLLIFLAATKEKVHLYIALIALLSVVKMLMDSNVTIFHFIPSFSYYIGYRMWLLVYMTIPLIFSLMQRLFPKEMGPRVCLATYSVFGIWCLGILCLPLTYVLPMILPITIAGFCAMIYLLVVSLLTVIRKRKYAVVHFISLSIMIGFSLYDLLLITKPDRGVSFATQFGTCIYLTIQSFVLLLRLMRSHTLSQHLAAELEIANQNLEATVALRTKELERSKKELERSNHQKDFLLTNASHDLKTSFHLTSNFTDIVLRDDNLTAQQRQILKAIHDTSLKSHEMLVNLLGWARMQINNQTEKRPIDDLSRIVQRCTDLLQARLQEKQLTVCTEIDDSLHFMGIEEQIQSIVLNLLNNAGKFSHPGSEIHIRSLQSGDSVEIHVQDFGTGMDERLLSRLFEPGKDNRRKGTSGEYGSGLGLFIVQELTDNNDGTITCTSKPGKGTDFILRFPLISSGEPAI